MFKKISTLILLFVIALSIHAGAQKFKAVLTDASNKPFTGKVVLYMSKNNSTPKAGGVGMQSFPCYAVTATNIKSGGSIIFDDNAISYPEKLSAIERGTYFVQAVWDKNEGGRSIEGSAGNIFSKPIQVTITTNDKQVIALNCDQLIPEQTFTESENVKELKVPSALLTSFYGTPQTVDAAVILPKEYATEPNRKFPVLFTVSGFGGDYHRYSGRDIISDPIDTVACIRVVLDGNCPLGHSVYANSDNNGPRGDALVKEFIPFLEKNYRCNGARLLTGHSSGGWTVLWLQTQYPKTFAGCWSSSPDPVDFRSTLTVNIYEDKNMFYNKDSALNPEASIDGFFPVLYMRDAYPMERVIYRGEQMNSLNAVFSKKGKDGNPEAVCDPVTGVINPAVVEHWKNYDISLNLRTNWEQLKPDLDKKIRITTGNNDNFYLNYAVHKLDYAMKKLNANITIEYFPGDHFTVSTTEFRNKGNQFLKEKYLEWEAKQ
ncbi:MAG: alpha/beta hydrolase-fold protein [Chitinophagaceae bacterium]